MSNQEFSEVYEFSQGFIQISSAGYFYVRMKNNSCSTIESIKESHEIMTSLLPEGLVYILVDAGIGSTSEDDIYEYIAASEFGSRVKAQAVLVHELASRLMGNLFLRFIQNKRHIKIFSKRSDAEKWLFDQMDGKNPNKTGIRKLMFGLS